MNARNGSGDRCVVEGNIEPKYCLGSNRIPDENIFVCTALKGETTHGPKRGEEAADCPVDRVI
jgi:hypothetical protein